MPLQDPPLSAKALRPPVILLTATLRWPIAARLAMAFAGLGCRVEVLCPRGHPATCTAAVARRHGHSTWRPLASLHAAVVAAAPDLIVPCDDDAALLLQRLHEQADPAEGGTPVLRTLIERSLGSPSACALATTRGRLLALAAELGVRVPDTAVVASAGELHAWLASHPLPAVLKIDGSWGGRGVAVLRSQTEARRAFAALSARPPLGHALVRTLLERDTSLLAHALRRVPPNVTLQRFIAGAAANRAVACWQGQVLAATSVEAIRTQHPTGPATVVRVIDHAEMAEAARRLVQRLGLSGLWGFDFVIEAAGGAAHLIELNPRATPICHLPLGAGHDLPAALCARLGGVAPARATIEHTSVALFPGEWRRDPASAHLFADFHDVPWHESALVRDGIALPWSERGLLARGWARLRPRSPAPPVPGSDAGYAPIGADCAE